MTKLLKHSMRSHN